MLHLPMRPYYGLSSAPSGRLGIVTNLNLLPTLQRCICSLYNDAGILIDYLHDNDVRNNYFERADHNNSWNVHVEEVDAAQRHLAIVVRIDIKCRQQ